MSRNRVIDDATLLEYLDGTLNEDARVEVEAALAESPELSEQLQALRTLLPMLAEAVDDDTIPVPPAPTWAEIHANTAERQRRLFGDAAPEGVRVALTSQSRDALVLACALIATIVSLSTFAAGTGAAFFFASLTALIVFKLFEEVKTVGARFRRLPIGGEAAIGMSPAQEAPGFVSGRRAVTITRVDTEIADVRVGGGLRITVAIPAARTTSILKVARGVVVAIQVVVPLLQLVRMLAAFL